MIRPVRPHVIFDRLAEDMASRMVTMPIPRRCAGSPLLLEQFILLAVGKIVKPERIFEIGTHLGNTARNLSHNFPDSQIWTLDINQQLSGQLAECTNVRRIESHSMDFDFSPYERSIGLVWVDGAHDYETVASDTAAAFKLLQPGGAIVWHDYLNPLPNFDGVTRVLREIEQRVSHIEESMMAVYFG